MKIKNYFLLIVGAMMLFSACVASNAYELQGKFQAGIFDGQKVVLYANLNQAGLKGLDSTTIKDNTFKLSGKVDSAGWYILMIQSNELGPIYRDFYLEKNVVFEFAEGRIRIKGTKINDAYQAFEDQYVSLSKELVQIQKQLQVAPSDTLQKKFNEKVKAFEISFGSLTRETILKNDNNPLGYYLFEGILGNLRDEDIEAILKSASKDFLEKPIVKAVSEQMAKKSLLKPGNASPDLNMMDPDGKKVALSDYVGKGKYVLIDFWASWCGPCIQEMPNIVSLYNTYKSKGFEIVGVSLDESKEEWKNALTNHQMTWPQMSDLLGWKSQAVSVFSFSGIPHTVLLNPSGKIVATGLRGAALTAKIGELLNVSK